jgi:hypothetical protein
LRSWVFDVGCALRTAVASSLTFSFAQTAHPAHPSLAVSLVVAVLTALVLPLRRVSRCRCSCQDHSVHFPDDGE